jgi:hypothetical protein
MGKAKRKKRETRRGYCFVTEISENKKAIVWGAEILHSINCGATTYNGVDGWIFYCTFIREILPDVNGKMQEALDMDMNTTDRISQHPFWQAICAGVEILEEHLDNVTPEILPSVKAEMLALREAGYSDYEIFMLGIYTLTEEFLCRTWDEGKEFFPEVFKTIESEDDEGNKYSYEAIRKIH